MEEIDLHNYSTGNTTQDLQRKIHIKLVVIGESGVGKSSLIHFF